MHFPESRTAPCLSTINGIPLNLNGNTLDTRGMPIDKRRGMPIPDASHQLKNTLMSYSKDNIKLIVATEQETFNLEKIAKYKEYSYKSEKYKDAYKVTLGLT